MAFQQPVHAPPRTAPILPEAQARAPEALPTQHIAPADAQEWVLFPTPQRPSPSLIRTASTTNTPQTAGLSRLSEFGSFNTLARSGVDNEDEVALQDDEDLDSLDEGLHAFQEHVTGQETTYADHIGSILPTHDGLGTFPGSSALVQEHLWQFESANPQRKTLGHSRRRSSIQRRLDALEHDDGIRVEKDRMERIERWRLEHSRILLEEVEKASRRRSSHQLELPTAATLDIEKASTGAHGTASRGTPVPFTKADARKLEGGDNPWFRFVQSFLQDLMGIDDDVLSLVFGEALLPVNEGRTLDTSTTGRDVLKQGIALQSSPALNLTILNHLSQELASALRQLSYTPAVVGSPVDRITLDYAGIPVAQPGAQQPSPPSAIQSDTPEAGAESTPNPVFKPTLEDRPRSAGSDFGHAALWGIEEESVDTLSSTQDREYWEQTPSIRTIFRLLHQHFTARRRPLLTASTLGSSKASNVATTSTADSLRRASVIRQHHPLVSCQHARRTAAINRHHSSHSLPYLYSPLFKRGEGSCASMSSRKSKRGSGSSRNYWDIGESIGSGSVGGIGVWGEV